MSKKCKARTKRRAAHRLNRRQLRFRNRQTTWGGANELHDAAVSLPKVETVS
jgi:hypothetical protein